MTKHVTLFRGSYSFIFPYTNTYGTEHLTIYRKGIFFLFTWKADAQSLTSSRTREVCHYICLNCYSQNFKELSTLGGNINACSSLLVCVSWQRSTTHQHY